MERECPVCKKLYKTVLPGLTDKPVQIEYPNAPAWQREQLISGVCSDECWNKMFKGTPDEDFEKDTQL